MILNKNRDEQKGADVLIIKLLLILLEKADYLPITSKSQVLDFILKMLRYFSPLAILATTNPPCACLKTNPLHIF